MRRYADIFVNNNIDGQCLSDITDASLQELGVKSVGHRIKLLKELKRLVGSVCAAVSGRLLARRPLAPSMIELLPARSVVRLEPSKLRFNRLHLQDADAPRQMPAQAPSKQSAAAASAGANAAGGRAPRDDPPLQARQNQGATALACSHAASLSTLPALQPLPPGLANLSGSPDPTPLATTSRE